VNPFDSFHTWRESADPTISNLLDHYTDSNRDGQADVEYRFRQGVWHKRITEGQQLVDDSRITDPFMHKRFVAVLKVLETQE